MKNNVAQRYPSGNHEYRSEHLKEQTELMLIRINDDMRKSVNELIDGIADSAHWKPSSTSLPKAIVVALLKVKTAELLKTKKPSFKSRVEDFRKMFKRIINNKV